MNGRAESWIRFVGFVLRVVDAQSDGVRAVVLAEYRSGVVSRFGDDVADRAVKELRGFAWGVMQGRIKRPVIKSSSQ